MQSINFIKQPVSEKKIYKDPSLLKSIEKGG